MTFDEALQLVRSQTAYVLGHDGVKLALVEQVEANRQAIITICNALIASGDLRGIVTTGLRAAAKLAKDGSADAD